MGSEVFYCRPDGNGRYVLGTVVDGIDRPQLRGVSEDNARRTGQMLLEAGFVLGSDFEINCITMRKRAA